MRSNMKLSTRIFSGFLVLVILTAIIGGTAWFSLRSVSQAVERLLQTETARAHMESTAKYRRDFMIYGLTPQAGQEKTADQMWAEAENALEEAISTLIAMPGLDSASRSRAEQLQTIFSPYKTSFSDLVNAEKTCQEAQQSWIRLAELFWKAWLPLDRLLTRHCAMQKVHRIPRQSVTWRQPRWILNGT